MSISKREKILILIALVFAVFCLYYFFFLKPYMDDMSALDYNIAQAEVEVVSNRQLESTSKTLAGEISEKQLRLDELTKSITQGFDQPPYLVYLDETVSQYGTKITYLFSDVWQTGQLYVCPVTVTLTSDYEGIKKMLSSFAKGAYFVKVTGLDITAFGPPSKTPINETAQDTVQDADQDADQAAEEIALEPPDEARELNVTLSLEFYSLIGDIPPDTTYTFGDGYAYGKNIFS